MIPDGAWSGPVTVTVQGKVHHVQTRSTGSGELQVFVEHGKVTGGTWALTWQVSGHSTSTTVKLEAQIAGTVLGTAAAPVVNGVWTTSGNAAVTSPVTASVPLDATGHASAPMSVTTTRCNAVRGTFVPSFRARGARATFTGTARWVGRPSA